MLSISGVRISVSLYKRAHWRIGAFRAGSCPSWFVLFVFYRASEPNPGRKFGASPWWHGWMIAGDYKLILGLQSYAMWMAPVYPNSTTNHALEVPFECGSGCLFNIQTDPSERVNLAVSITCWDAPPRMLHRWRTSAFLPLYVYNGTLAFSF